MRPVNLLPARYRPRTCGSGDSKTAYITLGVLAMVALAVFGYVLTASKVNSRNAEIAEVRERITAAQTQAVTLQGFGDFAGIKEARLTAVKSLATSRIDWERLFRELAHVVPSGVWLTGFQAQLGAADGGGEAGPAMALKGCAESHERIADAMVRLRELHVADDVELTKTQAGEKETDEPTGTGAVPTAPTGDSSEGCGRFYTFEISVLLAVPTAGSTTGADPVPARLGGGE